MIHNLPENVRLINETHKFAQAVAATLKGIFRPLVGKKIIKADGTLLAKYHALTEGNFSQIGDGVMREYRRQSTNSLTWTVKCSLLVNGIAKYYTNYVYLGEIDNNGVLVKLVENDFSDLRTDYTVEELADLDAKICDTKKVLAKLLEQMPCPLRERFSLA